LAPNFHVKDSCTIIGDKNLYRELEPVNADGTIKMVVEIPSGTNAKWEIGKDGNMTLEIRNGKPRHVEYLPYIGNYGLIPRTLSGDGDPLDVIVIGPAVPRGTCLNVKIVGALKLVDRGDADDKLIGVIANSYFDSCNTLAELDQKFPGVTTIIETWFTNYKGPGKMKSLGLAEAEEAKKFLDDAFKGYNKK
jgi:inorganic pyrophosphatase